MRTIIIRKSWGAIFRIVLAISLLVPAGLLGTPADAGPGSESEQQAASVQIDFDDFANLTEAGLSIGGGSSQLTLDAAVYRGDSGQGVTMSARTQTYNRIKMMKAFDGLDMQAGKNYEISLWAKVGQASSVTNGYFFLSVITYPGAIGPNDPPYYADATQYKFLVGQDGWTRLTLPYTATENVVYGVAVEQIAASGWTSVVPVFHIDDLEVKEVPPPTYKHLSFDNAASWQQANVSPGGAQPTWGIGLSDTVVRGVYGGKSLEVGGRLQHYNRIKFNDAFAGLDVTPGTQYEVSVYARTDAASPVKEGYFFLSVIDIPGSLDGSLAYYSDRFNYRFLVTDQDWVKLTLPYTVGVDPLYGIAVEQISADGYTGVVNKVYFDDVEVVKTGFTTEIPPSRLPPKAMQVRIDDRPVVYLSGKPEVKDGVPFVQMAKTFAVMRTEVDWNGDTLTATAVRGGVEISVTDGAAVAQIGGISVPLDAPAYRKDGLLMVPATFAADALNAAVTWDSEDKVLSIVSEAINVIDVDTTQIQQEIWGFGATANDPVHDLMNMSATTRETLLDLFFGTEGSEAGLSIVRLEVNPFTKSDANPRNALQATINPAPGVWDYDTDAHQRWFADEAVSRYPDVTFAGSVWSPPAWMKDNASEVRGGKLLPQHYDDFAAYLLNWAKRYKQVYGYDLRWLSVQNEPEAVVEYASALYNGAELGSVVSAVYDAFGTDGLDVNIGAPEGGHLGSSQKLLQQMDPAHVEKLDFIGAHFYDWEQYDAYNYDLRSYGKPLFMMEYSMPAPNDTGMEGGLEVADQINAALEQGYSSYLYWLFVTKPAQPTSRVMRESFVNLFDDGSYQINKRLYAMGQFSRFIRPGDYKVQAASGNGYVSVTAAKNTVTGKATMVAANRSAEPVTVTINGLTGSAVSVYRTSETEELAFVETYTTNGTSFTYTLPAKSVTTFAE